MPSTDRGSLPVLLYVFHTLLELVLGAVKLRGRYSAMATPPGAERFVRHHGVSLLAIALLGLLALRRPQPTRERLLHTEAGTLVSTALSFFHAGAVAVMLHSYATTGQGLSVALTHTPFALAFAWHARSSSSADAKQG